MVHKSTALRECILRTVFESAYDPRGVGELLEGTSVWLAAHVGVGPWPAGDQNSNEIATTAYGGYARISKPLDGTIFSFLSGPERVENIADVLFATSSGYTSGDNVVTHVSLGTAGSAPSDILYVCPIVAPGATWQAGTCKSVGGIETIIAHGHGYADADPVFIYPLYDDATVSGAAIGTTYYVRYVDADSFQLSTTSGGAANVNLNADQRMLICKTLPVADRTITAGKILKIPAGSLVIQET